MAEHMWDRQPGETDNAYHACELFRRLGPDRTVQQAWEQYWGRPGNRRKAGGKQAGQAQGYFRAWSSRHRWHERAVAWDEEVAALARDQELDRELKARLEAQEEERRQRQLMQEEARAARAVGRRLLRRLLEGIEGGELEQTKVADLLPHLQKVSSLLETGQKLDRLFSGEPSDVTRLETDTQEVIGKLLAILQEFVPQERWGELAEKLDGLEIAGT